MNRRELLKAAAKFVAEDSARLIAAVKKIGRVE